MIERRPSAEPKGKVVEDEASAEPKLTEKAEDLRQNRRERWQEEKRGKNKTYKERRN